MAKSSYIVLPWSDDRRGGPPAPAPAAALSSRVIGNAMRLLVAVILMAAMVVIIILAAHISVNNNQPVQPWVLAPTLKSANSSATHGNTQIQRQ